MAFKELSDFLSQSGTRQDIISEGILPAKNRLVVGGPPKIRKTTLITQMALELASGTPFLGLFDIPVAVPTMVAELEIDEESYRERVEQVRGTIYNIPSNFLFIGGPQSLLLDTPSGSSELVSQITALRPKVIILDPLWCIHSGDEDKSTSMKPLLMFLDKLVRDFHISVIIVHHTKKPSYDYKGRQIDLGMDALRGSNALYAWADSILMMSEIEHQNNILLRFWLRHGAVDPVILTPVPDKFVFTAQPQGLPTTIDEQAIIGILKASKSGILEYQSLIAGAKAKTGHAERSIRYAVSSLHKKALIGESGQGRSKRRVFLLNPSRSSWFLLE